jgi:hypothetical protein
VRQSLRASRPSASIAALHSVEQRVPVVRLQEMLQQVLLRKEAEPADGARAAAVVVMQLVHATVYPTLRRPNETGRGSGGAGAPPHVVLFRSGASSPARLSDRVMWFPPAASRPEGA